MRPWDPTIGALRAVVAFRRSLNDRSTNPTNIFSEPVSQSSNTSISANDQEDDEDGDNKPGRLPADFFTSRGAHSYYATCDEIPEFSGVASGDRALYLNDQIVSLLGQEPGKSPLERWLAKPEPNVRYMTSMKPKNAAPPPQINYPSSSAPELQESALHDVGAWTGAVRGLDGQDPQYLPILALPVSNVFANTSDGTRHVPARGKGAKGQPSGVGSSPAQNGGSGKQQGHRTGHHNGKDGTQKNTGRQSGGNGGDDGDGDKDIGMKKARKEREFSNDGFLCVLYFPTQQGFKDPSCNHRSADAAASCEHLANPHDYENALLYICQPKTLTGARRGICKHCWKCFDTWEELDKHLRSLPKDAQVYRHGIAVKKIAVLIAFFGLQLFQARKINQQFDLPLRKGDAISPRNDDDIENEIMSDPQNAAAEVPSSRYDDAIVPNVVNDTQSVARDLKRGPTSPTEGESNMAYKKYRKTHTTPSRKRSGSSTTGFLSSDTPRTPELELVSSLSKTEDDSPSIYLTSPSNDTLPFDHMFADTKGGAANRVGLLDEPEFNEAIRELNEVDTSQIHARPGQTYILPNSMRIQINEDGTVVVDHEHGLGVQASHVTGAYGKVRLQIHEWESNDDHLAS